MQSNLSFRPKHFLTKDSATSSWETSHPISKMPVKVADQHQNKRQINQSQITDFFGTGSNDYDASIQASLLNVGMRIRKAVPEGYKTHRTVSLAPISYAVKPSFPVAYSVQRPRELLPFCGLHIVGGLGVQPILEDEFSGTAFRHGGPVDSVEVSNTMDGPLSSQESNISVTASDVAPGLTIVPKLGAKRRLDFEDDGSDQENEDTSMSISVGHGGRYIAKPRSRRRDYQISTPQSFSFDVNMDFEDASFLVPTEDMDMGV